MKDTKAIKILKTLTPEEFKDFERFVASPYFNTSKGVIKIFNYIKKYYPAFEDKALETNVAVKKFSNFEFRI